MIRALAMAAGLGLSSSLLAGCGNAPAKEVHVEAIADTVTGADSVRHALPAQAGDALSVSFAPMPRPAPVFFNILPPGGAEPDAIFVGRNELEPNRWEGIAARTGEYTILVYQLGQARDGGAETDYTLRAMAVPAKEDAED